MAKSENLYLVNNHRGYTLYIWAGSGGQAKRIYCKKRGIRPSDEWLGISALTARKLKPVEISAWEKEMENTREVLLGMTEIFKKIHSTK